MPWSRLLTLAVAVTAVLGASGCGGSPAAPSGGGAATSTPDPLTGDLTVFAAASLTEAFNDAMSVLQDAHPGLSVTASFAGSQALVMQVRNGAPADVIATADPATMQTLVSAGLVDTPVTLARNRLEIVVAPGNPKHVTGLRDLGRSDLRVILADASVPAGKYGRQALQAQGITANPVSLPLDVRSELLAVEQGNADVGIVYVTDVASAGSAVTGVPIPAAQNIVATYPVAVVRATSHPAAARAFLAAMLGGAGQRALRARGFLAP